MLSVGCNCDVRAMYEEAVYGDMLGKPVQSRSFPKTEVLAKSLKGRSNYPSLLPTFGGTRIAYNGVGFADVRSVGCVQHKRIESVSRIDRVYKLSYSSF